MHGGEHVGGALHHTLAGLGHGHGRAVGEEDRLVAGTQRQVGEVVAGHQHHLLVAEAHLSACVARHVHATQEEAVVLRQVVVVVVVVVVVGGCRGANQLGLNGGVVLLVNDVVHTVSVDQEVLLNTHTHTHTRSLVLH